MSLLDWIRDRTPYGWSCVRNSDRMKAWRDGFNGDRVEVVRIDGPNETGWVAKVRREGTRESPHVQLTNGLVSRREALILADMYMADGTVVPAFPDHRRQDQWLAEEVSDYEFRVVPDFGGETDR